MAIRKTNAIIIRTIPFRSTSLIVTFFTKDFGKIKGIVKGVRQEREREGAVYELFTQLEIIYYEKLRSDLHLISEAFILDSYESLRSRLENISYASYFAELIDQLTEVHDPHEELFQLLDLCLRYLPSLPGERLSRLFETKVLKEIGWLPYLEACLHCEKRDLDRSYFSPYQGGLICKTCAPVVPDARPISPETLAALRYYGGRNLEECLKYPLSNTTEQGLGLLMHRFFLSRLQKPLKTREFLDKIQPALS